jgi:hypothetical protein
MAAKLYAMFLFYKGILKPYKLGPEAATLITTESNKMSVSFHCWTACDGKNPVIYAKAIKCIQVSSFNIWQTCTQGRIFWGGKGGLRTPQISPPIFFHSPPRREIVHPQQKWAPPVPAKI